MKTESTKNYNTGFVLTDLELRRIYILLIDEFKKKFSSVTDIKEIYEIKYKNGSISEPNSLDAIFNQENIGLLAITRLKIKITDNANPSLYEVTLQFTNLNVEEGNGFKPISYTIIGDDKDWVFTLDFQLDARIKRIKRFSLINLSTPYTLLMIFSFTPLLIVLPAVWAFPSGEAQQLNKLRVIEESYRKGAFKDPIEVIFQIEKFRIKQDYDFKSLVSPSMLFFFISIAIGTMLFLWEFFFPPYNLCWGEYVNFKQGREKIGKFLIIGVLFTLIMSIVSNYISALLGIGK